MSIPELRRHVLHSYMKVDDPEEHILIESLAGAAIAYLKGAGIQTPEEPVGFCESKAPAINADSYWLVVNAMTLYAYDNRTAVGFVPEGVRGLLNQLKLEANYPESNK